MAGRWLPESQLLLEGEVEAFQELGHFLLDNVEELLRILNGAESLEHIQDMAEQVQGELDSGQVKPKTSFKMFYQPEFLNVFLGVKPEHTDGPRRAYKPQPLVFSESLGVHLKEAGGHAYHVNTFQLPHVLRRCRFVRLRCLSPSTGKLQVLRPHPYRYGASLQHILIS